MIGIVTQARMTSTRLPGKILMEVNEKSLLQLHVERLKWSDCPIFIATTVNAADDIVESFANRCGIGSFRGSEYDVLSRYSGLASKYNLSTIIRVTSDCPLIDGKLIRQGIEKYLQLPGKNNYLTNCQQRSYPRGFDFEVFSREMLDEMQAEAALDFEREHVTPFIYKSHPERYNIHHFKRAADASRYRITVDEPADFELIKEMIDVHHCADKSAEQIISVLEENKYLFDINKHIEQKKV